MSPLSPWIWAPGLEYSGWVLLRVTFIAAFLICLTGCDCGTPNLQHVPPLCELNPAACVDAGLPPVDAGLDPCTDQGAVTGRVCAPDLATWLNGATVALDGTDCHGQPAHVETISSADGTFTLSGAPPGDWTIKATLGAFSQATPVAVRAGASTAIPDNQLCVAQKTVRIAVVTGAGDRIEDLLTSLRLQFTVFRGDSSTWTTEAEPFLSDLNALKQYDLVFIDCAAAKSSGTTIDLGPNAARIQQNLLAYVQQGGSVYGSDWALIFSLAAAPTGITFATSGGAAVASPFNATVLKGYAPQTVSARVDDAGLAQFLGKATLSITFPKQTGANSLHWGLMASTTGQVLVSAASVVTCPDTACATAGPNRSNVPLAVRVRKGQAGVRGGNVVYTSFHNVAQSGTDVAQVLKYLVLNL